MMPAPEALRAWCGGEWMGDPSALREVAELTTDSRRINAPAAAAFVAIRTARRDGHEYIGAAYKAGVRLFIVSASVDASLYHGAAFLLVADGVQALQDLASGYRATFAIPVIGITGSNGKTIVKEWLHQTLAPDGAVLRSPLSYNSQTGVPLSVWLLRPEHGLAIFEAGISQRGEMEKLEPIIKPTIGIFTNIGAAHSEGFVDLRQKAAEKMILFRNAQTIVYCRDHELVHEVLTEQLSADAPKTAPRLISWTMSGGNASLVVQHKNIQGRNTIINARWEGRDVSVVIPFTDAASLENGMHVWCTLLVLGLEDAVIAARMSSLQPIAMRLQTRRGSGGSTIINDAYNSDLTSLAVSLDYLEGQRQHPRHTLILSDLLQMGRPDAVLYKEVAAMIARRSIQRLIGIGEGITRNAPLLQALPGLDTAFYRSTDDFLREVPHLDFSNEAVLLKGARPFRFERIAALLEEEVHQTELSINLSALAHNLAHYRSITGPGVKVMAMVKAFSYGSGSYEIAQALQFAGIDYLTVAYTDEGVALRRGGITAPILVMSPEAAAFDRMMAWNLEPELYNLRSLKAFTDAAFAQGIVHYPVHLKLDTGMHRLGFEESDVDALLQLLKDSQTLKVASIFSHLAAAETPAMDVFTAAQAARFEAMSNRIISGIGYTPLRHLCNSAGIVRHPDLHYDMVRLGLGLYGIGSGGEQSALQPIATLRSTIAQIKDLPAGTGIGYGHADAGDHPRRIATVSVGYADGYPRALGHGKAHVLIHGKRAPIVGAVCMDMCMADVTEIPEAAEGDEVILWGEHLPLKQIAMWAGTIPYEIMTGVGERVRRVYVAE